MNILYKNMLRDTAKSALDLPRAKVAVPYTDLKYLISQYIFPLGKMNGTVRSWTSFILSNQSWEIGSPPTGGAGRIVLCRARIGHTYLTRQDKTLFTQRHRRNTYINILLYTRDKMVDSTYINSGVRRCQKMGGGGGAYRHVIYVPSVKNQYKRVVFGYMIIY